WSFEFKGGLAGADVPLMLGDGGSLTGTATIAPQTLTTGQIGIKEVQRITAYPSWQFPSGYYYQLYVPGATPTSWIWWETTSDALKSYWQSYLRVGIESVVKTGDVNSGFTYTVTYSAFALQPKLSDYYDYNFNLNGSGRPSLYRYNYGYVTTSTVTNGT